MGYFDCCQILQYCFAAFAYRTCIFHKPKTAKRFNFPFYSLQILLPFFFFVNWGRTLFEFFYFLGIFTLAGWVEVESQSRSRKMKLGPGIRSESSFHRTGTTTHLCQLLLLNTIVQYLFNVNEKRSPGHMGRVRGAYRSFAAAAAAAGPHLAAVPNAMCHVDWCRLLSL